MQELRNKIVQGDCIKVLSKAEEPFADLIFADPPFNIGYKYDCYKDRVKKDRYVAWTADWMAACAKVLKPHGSFYIAIGDDYAANVKLIATEQLGLVMRNWIIWHYTFGQQLRRKFARAHTHIFYFVKDKKHFTFNDEAVRIFSDRQRIYNDKRANPAGKMPDDVWNEYPRVCGTFEERRGWHPCQMPESLLARIIRVSSSKDDWVMDPFSGSGTTAVVAHKLNRIYTGIELSAEYVKHSRKRIAESEGLAVGGNDNGQWSEHLDVELKWLYRENKVEAEVLQNDSRLLTLFTARFNKRVGKLTNPYEPGRIKERLSELHKTGKLAPLAALRMKPSEGISSPTFW